MMKHLCSIRTTARFRLALLILCGWVLCATPGWARQQKLKLATLAPKGSTYYNLLVEMGQTWKETPGGPKLTIYPDAVMGGEGDMVRRMRVGQIQVSLMTANGLAEIDDSITALQNLPMMFNSFDEVEHVRTALMPMIEKKFLEKGFVLLHVADSGWVNFFSTKEASSPEEFKKLKIFSLSSDVNAAEVWKAAGYTPVALDTTDMLTGLKTGLVDVVPAPPYYALGGQFYRPAPFMLNLNWAPLVGGIVITADAWNKFPEETQKAMRKAAEEAGVKLMAQTRKENDEAVKTMQERGMKVLELTPEQREEWRKTVEKAYPMIRGKVVPADLFDKVKTMLAEYRKKAAE